ncbi:MAG: NAD(P)H-dependent oxidoreductase [Oscillospiraceae bacterium]|nr:NAD(P)H-dependent oxidoreductase [Oscillospiraceae bacterium]
MKKLLFINSCIRGKDISRTYDLCRTFLDKAQENEKDLITQTVDVTDKRIKPLYAEDIEKRDSLLASAQYDNDYFALANQFAAADFIVVGAPYWDLSFPSLLKVYIENIMVSGITFACTQTGFKGLCHAEKLIYISTAGGMVQGEHQGYTYIKNIAGMLGIPETYLFTAQCLDIEGFDADKQICKARTEIENFRL